MEVKTCGVQEVKKSEEMIHHLQYLYNIMGDLT